MNNWLLFFIGVVMPTYDLLGWLYGHFGKMFKRLLVRTETDAIIWAHHYHHALGQSHKPKSPVPCDDGDCQKI